MQAISVPDERRRRVGRFDDAVYRTAFDVSPLPICLFDLEGHFVLVNAAFCALVGAPPEDVVGRHVSAFNEPEENPESDENLRALVSGEVDTREVHRRLRTVDGRTVHVTARITMLHHDGEAVGVLSMVSDVTRHVEAQAHLRQLAFHDPLTGLANRQQLDPTLLRIERRGQPAAICFADLDDFKQLNDRFGHEVGDSVLATIGRRLREGLEEGDVAVRFGGDELVVVRPGVCDEDGALALGTRVSEVIAQPVRVGDQEVAVAVSVGVAFDPHPCAELLGRADAAMYEAKRAGSDAVRVRGPRPRL